MGKKYLMMDSYKDSMARNRGHAKTIFFCPFSILKNYPQIQTQFSMSAVIFFFFKVFIYRIKTPMVIVSTGVIIDLFLHMLNCMIVLLQKIISYWMSVIIVAIPIVNAMTMPLLQFCSKESESYEYYIISQRLYHIHSKRESSQEQ